MRQSPPLMAIALVMAVATASAADWSFAQEQWKTSASPDAEVAFAGGEAVITAKRGRRVVLERPIDLDGDDEEPLIISCALSVQGDQALVKAPMTLALRWPDAVVAVGILEVRGNERNSVARWRLGTEFGSELDRTPLDGGLYFNFARILLTSRDVTLSTSEDGLAWRKVASLPRSGPLATRPMQVLLGAGWGGQGNLDIGSDAEPVPDKGKDGNPPCTYRFAQITCQRISRNLPAALLATYDRGESREDTIDKLMARSFPKTWHVAGPFDGRKAQVYGPEVAPFDPAQPCVVGDVSREWQEKSIGELFHQRVILVSPADGKLKDKVYFAATTIDVLQDERVRFLYDGLQSVSVFVNGQAISHDAQKSRRASAEVDRLSVVADLKKGRNVVVLRLTANNAGVCAFVLRREPGDPRYRIALERRLAIDFPNDIEETAEGLFEAARGWVDLGHLRAAVDQLGELMAIEDLESEHRERAMLQRASLLTRLRDDEGATKEVDAIQEFWSQAAGADRATVLRRAAEVWFRQGKTARALDELAKAVVLDDLAPDRRLELELERIRLLILSNRSAEIAGDLIALAKRLPPGPERDQLLAHGAQLAGDPALIGDLLAADHPRAVRVGVGLATVAGDTAAIDKGWERLVDLRHAGPFDDPLVAHAESRAARGDAPGALALYGKSLARYGVKAPGQLDAARRLYLEARLGAYPEGKRLLELKSKAGGPVLTNLPITDWRVIGPFDNRDWRLYKKAAIDIAKTEGRGKEGGQEWQSTTPEHFRGDDILDFKRLFNVDERCAYVLRDIDMPEDLDAQISMGADDGCIVWVNGKRVYEDRTQRGVTPDSIQIPVQFTKGSNRLIIMVQNGNGDWGLQVRITVAEYFDQDLAAIVQKVIAQPAVRADDAQLLVTAAENAWRFGRIAESAAIYDMLCAGFPDQVAVIAPQARRLCEGERARRAPELAAATLLWWDARDLTNNIAGEDQHRRMGESRLWGGTVLGEVGRNREAAELTDAALWTSQTLHLHLQALRVLADIKRFAGDPKGAARIYEKIASVDGDISGIQRHARSALNDIRRIRTDLKPVTASIDATTALASAERAAAGNDLDHAQRAFQEAIAVGAGEVVAQDERRYVGIAWWCTQRLRSLPRELMAGYIQRFGRDADAALDAALARDDVDALEAVAARWPIAPAAGKALVEAAARYRAVGADLLAVATAKRARENFGFSDAITRQLDELSRPPSAAAAPPMPTALVAQAYAAIPADALHDLRRLIDEGAKTVHVAVRPAVATGMAILHTGVEVVAVDLARGEERWRKPALTLGAPQPTPFAGMPVHGAVVIDGVVIGRSVGGARPLIEGRALEDGRLLWSTADRGELGDFEPVAAPTGDGERCLVLGTASGRGEVIAFRPRDGAVVWRVSLPMAVNDLGITGSDISLPIGRVSGVPAIDGRDVYLTLDAGCLVCLDGPTGVVRWVSTYPRSIFHANHSQRYVNRLLERMPGGIAIGRETVAVLPRDRNGLFAVNRTDGSEAWSTDLSQARVLAGVLTVGADDLAILHGEEVEAVNLRDGRTVWTWSGADPTIGSALVQGGKILVSTTTALVHLDGADGKVLASRSWRDLGIVGTPPGCFAADGNRLIGASNSGLAILAAGAKPPAKPVPFIPMTRRSQGPLASAQAAIDPARPLGIAWRLPGVSVVSFPQADDPQDDEVFATLRDGLASIDPQRGTLRWRIDLPSDLRRVAISGPGVLVLNDGTMGYYTRSSGSPRWILPITEDVLRGVREPWRLNGGLGERYAAAFAHHYDWFVLREARSGKLVLRESLRDHRLLWIGEVGDRLVVVAGRGSKEIVIQHRSLDEPSQVLADFVQDFPNDNCSVVKIPGRNEILIMGQKVVWADLAGGAFTQVDIEGSWPISTRVVGGDLELFSRRDNRLHFTVMSLADRSIRFTEKTADGWMQPWDWNRYGYGGTGDLYVRSYQGKDNKTHLVGADAKGGRTFDVAVDMRWVVSYVAFAGIAGRVHALSSRSERLSTQIIGSDGSIVAEAPLPVTLPKERLDLLLSGDTWLLGCADELVGLRPLAEPTTKAANLGDAAVRARIGLPTPEAIALPKLETAPLIDGHFADWGDLPEVAVGPEGIRDLGGQRTPKSLRVRLAQMVSGIALAATVGDDGRRDLGLGLPDQRSDGLIFAIDPRDDGREGQTVRVHVGIRNGRSVVTVSGDLVKAHEGGTGIQARAARGDGQTRYEIFVPWSIMRRKEEHRPGDRRWLRLGVAAVHGDGDQAGALEYGFNVAIDGASPWWIPVDLGKAFER